MNSVHSLPSALAGREIGAPVPAARKAQSPRAVGVPVRPATRFDSGLGWLLVALFVAGLGGWAALAPLAAATMAPGQIVVEGSRRTVQHLEGGIIREFLVRDGAVVGVGDVLVRLDDTQTAATTDALRGTVDGFRALDARLTAERDDAAAIAFPEELLARRADQRVAEILSGQEAIFVSRRVAMEGQVSILRQRIEQLRTEIRSYESQVRSLDEQLGYVKGEVDDVRSLVDKGLERRPRLLSLQRTAAQLVGARDQQEGLIAKGRQAIGETELQLMQIRNARQAEVAAEQRDLQTRLAEAEERLRAANDVQRRREVVAPVAGTVTSLRFHTVGGVVRPGEPLLDIVPRNEGLVVEVRVQPTDIDVVEVGMLAEVRLSAFKQRTVPTILGKVVYVAADVEADPRGMQSFYRAKVRIDDAQLAALQDVQLAPGMPAEVMIKAGERTMLRYLAQPILDSFHRAFREQ
ncbi:MAG: HlyD family type I secretion periplasmic adaptor subunit [Alphaproteobacteria bacterium]|nr:HlyD family type I secretion periplasmic adaptor subunit [Alphaproteobacteria bacterium]